MNSSVCFNYHIKRRHFCPCTDLEHHPANPNPAWPYIALIKSLFQKQESSHRLAKQPAVSLCATTRCSCCCQEGHLSIIHCLSDFLQVLQFPRRMLGCSFDGNASKSNIKCKRSDQFQECSLNAWSQILECGQTKHC